MANTRFEPHFIQDSLYNTKYSNVCAEECEAFKLGFILLFSLFIYKFSSQFFKASQSSIRPLNAPTKASLITVIIMKTMMKTNMMMK